MDADGMVNCWATKVLKNMMSSTAKQTTSRLSRRNPLPAPGGAWVGLSGAFMVDSRGSFKY